MMAKKILKHKISHMKTATRNDYPITNCSNETEHQTDYFRDRNFYNQIVISYDQPFFPRRGFGVS